MKKIIIVITSTLVTLSVAAQSTFIEAEHGFTLNVAGVDLTFIQTPHRTFVETSTRNSRYRPHIGLFELGFNTPTQTSYKAYPSDTTPWFDLWQGKSTQVTFNLLSAGTRLSRSGNVGLSTAFGISWNNYIFNDPTKVKREGGTLTATPIESAKWIKSKISTFSLRVPILLEFGRHKSFFGSVGVYGDLTLDSRSKVKYGKGKKEVHRNMNVALPQAGVTARFGYKRIYIFSNYSLTHLFTKNKGPQTNILTIGFGLGL